MAQSIFTVCAELTQESNPTFGLDRSQSMLRSSSCPGSPELQLNGFEVISSMDGSTGVAGVTDAYSTLAPSLCTPSAMTPDVKHVRRRSPLVDRHIKLKAAALTAPLMISNVEQAAEGSYRSLSRTEMELLRQQICASSIAGLPVMNLDRVLEFSELTVGELVLDGNLEALDEQQCVQLGEQVTQVLEAAFPNFEVEVTALSQGSIKVTLHT